MSTVNVIDQLTTERYALYHGDCIETLQGLPDNSLHYSVFSPPFSSMYVYSDDARDMGNCSGMEEFMVNYAFLAEQLIRVIKPGRIVSVHCMNVPTLKSREGHIGLIDFRGLLIRAMEEAGFYLHGEVCVWKDPVTQMQRTKALGLLHKQIKKDSCMSRMGLPDYVLHFRKPGANPEPVEHTDETFPVDQWQQYASPIWMDINPSDTLQYMSAREHDDERHICPLQLEVIRRCLRLYTNPDDIVLSPFTGIGSEGYCALEMGRRFGGCELKTSYFKQAAENLRRVNSRIALF